MKTTVRILACLTIVCCGLSASYAEVIITGPGYTCPNSELIYYYDDDRRQDAQVDFVITNGKIFNIFSQTWESAWTFDRGVHTDLNETWPFRIRWDNLPLGTVGKVWVQVCGASCVNATKNVTFGGDPATPTILGDSYLLNCLSQQKNYTATSIPQNWNLVDWTFTSQIEQVGGTANSNPVTVRGTNTTFTGTQTLTGIFHFITNGNHCATKNVNKSIWVGRPNPTIMTVNGSNYTPGTQLCGDNWVGIEYSTPVSSTSWTFDPSLPYYYSDAAQCNFNVDSSWPDTWRITAVGTNACGAGYAGLYYFSKGCWYFMVSAYPNPASSELTIETLSIKEKDNSKLEIVPSEVLLLDKSSSKLIQEYPTKSTVKLDIQDIPKGAYILQIKLGDKVVKKHILIDK
jgi:hypothetical protein